jgi:KDO2-lipid IV(A) lauroyltransferase
LITRFSLAILWLVHFLPRPIISGIGASLGILFYALSAERRHVVEKNLALCFKQKPTREQKRLRRRHFISLGRAITDSSIAWWGSEESIRKLASVKGKEHLDRALSVGPVIVLAPHFVGVEILGIRLSLEENAQSMYSQQKDPVLNQFLISKRSRFRDIRLFSRQEGIKNIVRSLKARLPLFFLPDMDFGPRDAVFVPFFGVPAATINAVPRLAMLTNARIVPVTIRQTGAKSPYRIQFFEAWDNYPTGDSALDTRRMNAFIEDQVIQMPEQYYWVHKRFKTRPDGQPSLYEQ